MSKIAFVFAGQGAQHPGMGRSIYEASASAREVMDRAEAIRPGTLSMCFSGGAQELAQTVNTQPCVFLVDVACALAVVEAGFEASMCAGFSLGELAALCFGGVLDFESAFRLVIRRAELMQAAAQANPGRMAAILRLSAERVVELAARFERVYPVNFNCPGQTVVACSETDYGLFVEAVAAERGRAVPLDVSGAFHSPFMASASDGLRAALAGVELSPPSIPVYANLTAMPYDGDLAGTLANQVKSPVLWERTVLNMRAAGAQAFVELGAGTTLSGLIRKTLGDAAVYSVQDMDGLAALKAARAEGIFQ